MRAPRLVLVLAAAAAFAALPASAGAKLPVTVNGSVPPGGSATFGSPPITPGAKTMGVEVRPRGGDGLLDAIGVVLASSPSPKDRFLTCVSLYRSLAAGDADDARVLHIELKPNPISTLFLAACIEMAAELSRPAAPPTGRAAATKGCPPSAARIGIRLTGSGSRRGAVLDGTPRKVAKPALKITCKRKGRGYVLRLRARKKGASLKSVAGSRLRLGFVSPPDATRAQPLAVTFRK